MQPIQMAEALKTIVDSYSDTPAEDFLSYRWAASGGAQNDREARIKTLANEAIKAIPIFTSNRLAFQENPIFVETIRGFQLDRLLDPEFPLEIASAFVNSEGPGGPVSKLDEVLRPINRRWTSIRDILPSLEKTLIPGKGPDEKANEDVLTVELKYAEDVNPQPHVIAKALLNAEKLYQALAEALEVQNYPPLVVIFVASGTSFRFDLKGLGGPIKQIKELIVQAWTMIRHRRVEDYTRSTQAILTGLDVIEKIDEKQKANVISHETALRLKEVILKNTVELFDAGILIGEIPDSESVPNKTLVQARQQKLLKSPESAGHGDAPPRKPRSVVAARQKGSAKKKPTKKKLA